MGRGKKDCLWHLGHMTKIAATPIYIYIYIYIYQKSKQHKLMDWFFYYFYYCRPVSISSGQ